ncbi:RNA polymerase sigma factor [Longispora sp. NPDC051575]|uniref:RNA polymerase sigma factor n=1 Tax=Longispora sp. NPDC051575 TaxID=3154943 RepID=UPI003418C48E
MRRSRDDPEYFAAVFDRHAVAVHRYLARRVGTGHADDLLGQTFLLAFEQRSRYDPDRADARPWLYGIATNLLRRHRRDEARLLRALAEPAPCDPTEQIAARVDASGMSRRLAAALGRLTRADRDTLLLFAWAELSYEEISRALAIPTGTVRSRLHRARAQVRAALNLGDDDE